MPGVNQTPFYAAYVPTSDVQTNYNALNGHLEKRLQHGLNFSAVYTWSKSMDNASEEGPGFASNQTDPANPRAEYGPSDFDVRHRVQRGGNVDAAEPQSNTLVKEVLGNWQVNGIYTWHTGFPWTPVIGVPSVALVNGASTIAPTRPTGYGPRSGAPAKRAVPTISCSNSDFIHGGNFPDGGANYFVYGTPGPPGIGRNHFNGPCYHGHRYERGQAGDVQHPRSPGAVPVPGQLYNILNHANLQPIGFGSTRGARLDNPSAGTHVNNPLFGFSPGADSGRVIEFFGRMQF